MILFLLSVVVEKHVLKRTVYDDFCCVSHASTNLYSGNISMIDRMQLVVKMSIHVTDRPVAMLEDGWKMAVLSEGAL
jgi:hypothetical protein